MSEDKKSKSVWGIVLKVILTVATAMAGALESGRLQIAMRTITLLIIHCSATPQGVAANFEDCRRDHIHHRGFRDIGYHFYLTRNGEIHRGRPLEKIGAHCLNHNRHSIGICYEGGTGCCKFSCRYPIHLEQKLSIYWHCYVS